MNQILVYILGVVTGGVAVWFLVKRQSGESKRSG